jgi:hypothetical protein
MVKLVTENTTLFLLNLKDVALNRLNSCPGVEWLMTSGSVCGDSHVRTVILMQCVT